MAAEHFRFSASKRLRTSDNKHRFPGAVSAIVDPVSPGDLAQPSVTPVDPVSPGDVAQSNVTPPSASVALPERGLTTSVVRIPLEFVVYVVAELGATRPITILQFAPEQDNQPCLFVRLLADSRLEVACGTVVVPTVDPISDILLSGPLLFALFVDANSNAVIKLRGKTIMNAALPATWDPQNEFRATFLTGGATFSFVSSTPHAVLATPEVYLPTEQERTLLTLYHVEDYETRVTGAMSAEIARLRESLAVESASKINFQRETAWLRLVIASIEQEQRQAAQFDLNFSTLSFPSVVLPGIEKEMWERLRATNDIKILRALACNLCVATCALWTNLRSVCDPQTLLHSSTAPLEKKEKFLGEHLDRLINDVLCGYLTSSRLLATVVNKVLLQTAVHSTDDMRNANQLARSALPCAASVKRRLDYLYQGKDVSTALVLLVSISGDLAAIARSTFAYAQQSEQELAPGDMAKVSGVFQQTFP